MSKECFRGEIYYTDLGKGIGSEQEGRRPVVIVQNDVGNKYSPTVIIAPITTDHAAKAKLPTHCCVGEECGLNSSSVVLLEQLRTIDKRRLEGYVGQLNKMHIKDINYALAVSIGLDEGAVKSVGLTLCRACANNFKKVGVFILRRHNSGRDDNGKCKCCGKNNGIMYELKFQDAHD
ncbi:MAG: type II toxin-antitoxin system PemK/MazF family toxin [Eubacteriales bacterium]|nr:type II toxin-antitoxin system PemK/MazF family toxin [Eubacteriales bacterium]